MSISTSLLTASRSYGATKSATRETKGAESKTTESKTSSVAEATFAKAVPFDAKPDWKGAITAGVNDDRDNTLDSISHMHLLFPLHHGQFGTGYYTSYGATN